jgi:integrase
VTSPVGDVDADVIAAWQQTLAERGATKSGRGLGPNSIRLARAPLNGAFKQATARGRLPANPLTLVARPRLPRRKPQHWTPEQARHFLALHEDDRRQPLWAFLLSSGLRIGELVWLRWANVDLDQGLVRINEFATSLGYELHASEGKSTDAVRTIDIDDLLIDVLRTQRRSQVTEQMACQDYVESDYTTAHDRRSCGAPGCVGPLHTTTDRRASTALRQDRQVYTLRYR